MKIHLAMPAFGANVSAHTMRSVNQLTHALRDKGIDWSLDFCIHESLIPRARNLLAQDFLDDPDSTHNMWIDADIKFSPEDFFGLLDSGKELVVGAYPAKVFNIQELEFAAKNDHPEPLRYATRMVINHDYKLEDGESEREIPLDKGCIPITEGATGFMLVAKRVYEKLIERWPNDYVLSDDPRNKGRKVHTFFADPVVNHRHISEDYYFCRRAAIVGIQPWCYIPANLGHVGQHIYYGDVLKVFNPHKFDTKPEAQ